MNEPAEENIRSNVMGTGFLDALTPSPSIATQAEALAKESANRAAPQIPGAPVRQSAYNRALLDDNEGDAQPGIQQRIRDAANQDIRGQVHQQELQNAMTDGLPEPDGGFVASAKSAVGQAIKGAGRIGSDYLGYETDNPIAEYGQRIIDANPVAVRELSDIADSPFLAFKESTGNAAGMMSGMVGAKALGMGITTAAPLARPAAVAALPSYASIRDSQILKDPENEQDAKSKAIAALGAGAVGAIEQAFGPQQWALAAMTKEGRSALARKFAATSRLEAVIKGGIKGAAIEGAEELVQAPIEQLASYDNPLDAESINETLFSGAMGAIGGLGTGSVVGGITPLQSRNEKAAQINAERTRLGLDKIASSESVDEAINAAAETVSQKPVTPTDIFDDAAARNDLLRRAEEVSLAQQGVVQDVTPAEEVLGVNDQQIPVTQPAVNPVTPGVQEAPMDQAVMGGDDSISDPSSFPVTNNVADQDTGNIQQPAVSFSRTPDERLKDRDRSIRLERALRNSGHDYRITPLDMRDALALGNRTEQEVRQTEDTARAFGKRVVWITADGPQDINGVIVPSIKDTIFIDARSPNSTHAVVGHELSHHMEHDAPQAYADMVESLKPFISGHAEYRAKYRIPDGETVGNVTKEMVGDVMGDNFNKPEFWQKVAEHNPSSFKRIADSVMTWLKRLVTHARMRGLGSEQWVSDIKAAQDIVAEAVAKYSINNKQPISKDDKLRFALAIRKNGYKTIRDFVIPETPEYADNKTGDLAYVPENDKIPSAPIRVEIGLVAGAHRGRGLMHIADNVKNDPSRLPNKYTGDRAEDIMRNVLDVMRGANKVYQDGPTSYVFVNPSNKRSLVTSFQNGYYSVITDRPSVSNDAVKSEWSGRLTLPRLDDSVSSPSIASHQSNESPSSDRHGLEGTSREKVIIPAEDGKSQPKKPAVTVKKKRDVGPKLSRSEQNTDTSKTVFDQFAALGASKGNVIQALSDAKKITGLNFKIPAKSADLGDKVPAKLNVDDWVIYYNKKWDFSRADGAQYIAEELFHALDVVGNGKTLSASSERLHTLTGDIYLESKNHFEDGGKYFQYLAYPISEVDYPGLSAHTRQAELFARLGVLYMGDLDKMKSAFPLAYEAYYGIFQARGSGINDEVSRKIWNFADSHRQMGGEHGSKNRDVSGNSGRTGDRPGSDLEQIREVIAREFNADPDGSKVLFSRSPIDHDPPSKLTLEILRAKHGKLEPWFRQSFGYGFEGLTESEARFIINAKGLSTEQVRERIIAAMRDGTDSNVREDEASVKKTDDEIRKRAATARDSRRERLLAKGVSKPEDSLKFSRTDTLSQAGVNTEETAKPSGLPEETKTQAFRRRSQDAMLRFKVVQNWLQEQGVNLSEAANVYQRENISKGKTANKIEDFRRDQLEPLIKRIAETSKKEPVEGKFDLADIATYLEAVHIPEANARMRLIHKDDKATANGITDEQAQKVIKQFEAMPNFKEFRKLADEMRKIGTETLDMRLEAGLISQEQYDAYKAAYQNWVPLRGNMSQQGFGKGMSTNAKDKRRMGHRFREDEFVIENLVQDRERAIMQIEGNKVGLSVAEFLMEAMNPNIGTIDQPEKMRVMKDFSYAVNFKGRVVGSFETETAAQNAINRVKDGKLLADGESFTQTDFSVEKVYDPHIVMMAKPQLAENEIQIYINGHAVKLQLNDPGLARAATNAGIEQVGALVHGARAFNRFLSKAYTAWSPDFLFMNMARDAQSGTLVLTGKKGAAFAAKTFANYGTAIKELIKGRKDPKKSQWVSRYRAAGGNIGAAYLSDLERVGEDALAALQEFAGARETYRMVYNDQISQGASEKKARTMAALKAGVAKTKATPVIGHLFQILERMNMVIENALRLATFKTAVENGESDQQAAMLSKDLMNFNRKGEVANTMGALYLFYNPGMQGAHIVGEALFTSKHRKQVWAMLGAMTALSFTLAELARGGGDDDDEREWQNVPDHVKDRNIIFNVGGKQILVPVPYGFGIWHAMGNYLSNLNHGADTSEIAVKLTSGMFENFSVFGNPIVDKDDETEIRLDQLLPTLPKLIMGPGINMDSLGRQIQPDKAIWNRSIPDSQNMTRSVRGTVYEDIANFMNEITGGSKYNPGAIDISPNTIKYGVTSLTGGAGRFVSDVVTGVMDAAEGVAPEIENIPILRKFVREPGVADSRAAFHKAKREVESATQRFKSAHKDGDTFHSQKMLEENYEVMALIDFATSSAKMSSAARDEVLNIQANKDLSKADKKLRIKEIELQEQRVYDDFLRQFSVAKDKLKGRQ